VTRERVDPGWEHFRSYTFAPAVRAGAHVYVSGMTASGPDGRIVAPGDIVGQTRHILGKVREVLAAAGATMDDVVLTRDYYLTEEGYAQTAAVRREFFGDSFPAATGVKVAGLLREGALIEIEVIAVTG
jgi:enamine deaminase RidA (YjgF/YER057c/UK114 family)